LEEEGIKARSLSMGAASAWRTGLWTMRAMRAEANIARLERFGAMTRSQYVKYEGNGR
jgi:hypothetical protein